MFSQERIEKNLDMLIQMFHELKELNLKIIKDTESLRKENESLRKRLSTNDFIEQFGIGSSGIPGTPSEK